jgi:hypothetical protein
VVEANIAAIKKADKEAEQAEKEAVREAKALQDVDAAKIVGLDGKPAPALPGGSDEESGALLDADAADKKLVDGDNEFQILVALCKKTPVWCFVLYVFVTNLGTYIASFPIVPYLTDDVNAKEAGRDFMTVGAGAARWRSAGCLLRRQSPLAHSLLLPQRLRPPPHRACRSQRSAS